MPQVTIGIRTGATTERRESLHRAIDSVLTQPNVDARVLCVVNGPAVDESVVKSLARPGVETVRQHEGHCGTAFFTGYQFMTTPYVGFLDDDDVLLPDTLAWRVERMNDSTLPDVLVTDGRRDSGTEILGSDYADAERDPLRFLLTRRNWLANGSFLVRRSSVPAHLFADLPLYLQLTPLAARFLHAGLRIVFDPRLGYEIADTPGSRSKQPGFVDAELHVLRSLRTIVPWRAKRWVDRKLANTHHGLSERARKAGDRREAWAHHWATLRTPTGLRFLPYTRHLFRPFDGRVLAGCVGAH